MKKILIIGGEGYVGSEIDFGIKLSKKNLNILDKNSLVNNIKKYEPEIIINLAAVLFLNKKNKSLMKKINYESIYNLVYVCKKFNIKLIHFSSAAVFSGSINSTFHEYSSLKPLNYYGKTKKISEQIIKKNLKNYLILRLGWVFGSLNKKNQRVFENLINKLRLNETINLSYNQFISPLYISDLNKILKDLIANERKGIFNISNQGFCTAYEFFKYIKIKISSKSNLIKVDFNEFNKNRSPSEMIYSKKIYLKHWKKAINNYLENLVSIN